MQDPDTTLRMDAPPSFDQVLRPTILGLPAPPLAPIPVQPTLILGSPPPPCDAPVSHEAIPVEVEVEAPISAAAWVARFEPVSVRPPAEPRAPRRWPWYLVAALSGGLLGAAFYLRLHVRAGGAL